MAARPKDKASSLVKDSSAVKNSSVAKDSSALPVSLVAQVSMQLAKDSIAAKADKAFKDLCWSPDPRRKPYPGEPPEGGHAADGHNGSRRGCGVLSPQRSHYSGCRG
jgi:hypothetical protein